MNRSDDGKIKQEVKKRKGERRAGEEGVAGRKEGRSGNPKTTYSPHQKPPACTANHEAALQCNQLLFIMEAASEGEIQPLR